MFKFIHAADVHLDSPLRGLSAYEDAPIDVIRSASRRAFEKLVRLALDEQVAFVLLAGDLFDGSWNDFQSAMFLAKQLGRLDKAGVRVFVVLGNHDAQNRMVKKIPFPKNLHLFGSRSAKTEVLDVDDTRVAIHGRSFALSRMTENLAVTYPTAKPGMLNIGLLHTSLDGREGHDTYAPCSVDDLLGRGYQYWALGHVHQQEFVRRDPWIVFPGCLQGRHVRETGAKGCVLVSAEGDQITAVEPVELDVLRWVSCDVSVEGASTHEQVFERVSAALADVVAEAQDRPVAARVHIHGNTPVAATIIDPAFEMDKNVRLQAAGVDPDGLWIEKVEVDVSPAWSLDSVLEGDEPQDELLRRILDVPEQPEAIEGLDDVQRELLKKLNKEMGELDWGQDYDEHLRSLIRDAKLLLIERLLDSGAGS